MAGCGAWLASDLILALALLGGVTSLAANLLGLVYIVKTHGEVKTPNGKTLGTMVAAVDEIYVQPLEEPPADE